MSNGDLFFSSFLSCTFLCLMKMVIENELALCSSIYLIFFRPSSYLIEVCKMLIESALVWVLKKRESVVSYQECVHQAYFSYVRVLSENVSSHFDSTHISITRCSQSEHIMQPLDRSSYELYSLSSVLAPSVQKSVDLKCA